MPHTMSVLYHIPLEFTNLIECLDILPFRFNDRQGPGGQNMHRDYRGRNEYRGGYRHDPHRGDHYRPNYDNHYRDQQHYRDRDRSTGDRSSNDRSIGDRTSGDRSVDDWGAPNRLVHL